MRTWILSETTQSSHYEVCGGLMIFQGCQFIKDSGSICTRKQMYELRAWTKSQPLSNRQAFTGETLSEACPASLIEE
jgi:hypothetical protein